MSARAKIIALFAAFASGALILVVAATALLPQRGPTAASSTSSVGGSVPSRGPDRRAGHRRRRSKGKPTLIFFGFTPLPRTSCPTALFELSEIFAALGPDADKVQAFFVTVDPERDTPEALKAYLSSFAPQLRALTGTPAEIDAIKKEYRVYSRKVPLDGGDYTMDHTAVIYLMDKSGTFLAPFNAKRPAAEAAADLRRVM